MLNPETPFPYVGSYALFTDTDLPEREQRTELVRVIMRREGEVVVSFPLRDGAAGNKRVDATALIDATPLTTAEAREFHDLDRGLPRDRVGRDGTVIERARLRTKNQKAKGARRDALRQRMIWSRFMERKLAEISNRAAAEQRRRAA